MKWFIDLEIRHDRNGSEMALLQLALPTHTSKKICHLFELTLIFLISVTFTFITFFSFFKKKFCEAKQTIPHTHMWFNTTFARGFSNVNLHTLYSIDSHEIWQHYTHFFWKHLSSTLLSSFIWYMGRNFL